MAEEKSEFAADKNNSTATENSTISVEETDTVPDTPTTSKITTENSKVKGQV